MNPYDESLVLQTNEAVAGLYAEADHAIDAQYPIWIARTVYDYCAGMSWPASESKHLNECRSALGLIPPPPIGGPLPTLRAQGTTFVDQTTGQLWKWRGVSAFALYEQYLKGQDIGPFCAWAAVNRINILRVFAMYDGLLGRLVPYEQPGYYEKLGPFCDAVGQYGLSVEWVGFADMGTPALRLVDAQSHYANLVDVLLGRPGVVLEVCNEPFMNDFEPRDVYAPFSELAQALGLDRYEGDVLPHAQYLTDHTSRDDEWPRKAKHILEKTRMGEGSLQPTNIPGVCDEPMGIGPDQPGRRSMDASDHAEYHALAMLFGSGSTIHGDFGLETRLPNAQEQAIVDAIVASWDAVPPECQLWEYTAGHLAECPLQDNGLRTYGMIAGNTAVMVRVRATEGPVAQNGWSLVTQAGYGGCVVTLTR